MARRAVITDTSKMHFTNGEKKARNSVEEQWRHGTLAEYEPSILSDEERAVFSVIASALPEDKLAKVDGYSIEIAANAIAQMAKANADIERRGLTVTKRTKDSEYEVANPNIAIYKTYSDIAKRYLVELGCTPSARAKIAYDAAKQLAKPQGVYDIVNGG